MLFYIKKFYFANFTLQNRVFMPLQTDNYGICGTAPEALRYIYGRLRYPTYPHIYIVYIL